MRQPLSARVHEFRVGAVITVFMTLLLAPVVLLRTPRPELVYSALLLLFGFLGGVIVYRSGGFSPRRNFFVTILPSLLVVFLLNHLTGAATSRFSELYFVAVVFALAYSGLSYGIAAAAISLALEFVSLDVDGMTLRQWEVFYIHVVVLAVLAAITLYYSWRQAFLRTRLEAVNEICYGLHRGDEPQDVVQTVIDQTARITRADGIFVYENERQEPRLVASTGNLASGWSELRASPQVLQIRSEIQDHVYKVGLVNPRWADQDLVDNLGRHVTLALERAHGRQASYEELKRRGDALERAHFGTLHALVHMLEHRDPYTSGHSRRVAAIAGHLAQATGAREEADNLRIAGILHDVGKIALPDAILLKPGPLTEDDWAEMRRHPEIGVSVISQVPGYEPYVPAVLHHHERWDGLGYPARLSGPNIPLAARLLAAADAFDAMTTNRAYRQGRSTGEACHVLRQGAGSQWDPDIARTLAELMTATPVDELVEDLDSYLLTWSGAAPADEVPAS